MTNSDYLLKAAIKKVTEKLNKIVVEKIEEASNIAQDVPEKIKKEFDTLKDAIIEEAARMENEVSNSRNVDTSESNQDPYLRDVLQEIEDIKAKIDHFNRKILNIKLSSHKLTKSKISILQIRNALLIFFIRFFNLWLLIKLYYSFFY